MTKYFIILLLSGLFLSKNSEAQDVHFSQFSQTPQLINPAATGVYNGKMRGILNYRTQWGSLGKAYSTYAASFDLPILKNTQTNKAYFGLGANFYKDVAGDADFGNFLASLSVSGILPIAKNHTLSVGMQTSYGQYAANLAKLTWGNQFNGETFDTQINSNENFTTNSAKYFDLGAGIFYEFKNTNTQFMGSEIASFNVGISGYHLNKPTQNFLSGTTTEIQRKFIVQAAGTFDIRGSNAALVPSVFFAFQGAHKEITPGMLLKLKFGGGTKYSGLFKESAFLFGAHYRIKDAIIPQLYFEFTDYMIGISYDYNNSALSQATGGYGGFEISIKYVNRPKAIQHSSF